MCAIDPEPCDVWSETPRMARKPHSCSCCRGAIAAGEAYLQHFSLYGGDTTSNKCCFACWLAREEFAQAHEGARFPPSFMPTAIADCIGEGDDDDRWRALLAEIHDRGERRAA